MTVPQGKKGKSIQSRLALLLLFILIPVLAIQAYIYYESYQAQRAEEFQANLEIARVLAKAFEAFVQDVLHQELAIGVAITSSSMTARDSTRLLETSRDYDAVSDFTWMNPEGDAVYSSNPAMIGNNYMDRTYFREVANGREWTVGELVMARTTGKPVFGISRGIRDDKGDLLGIVVATVIPEKLDARLAVERSKGGGHALVDHRGMLVYRCPAIDATWDERNWIKQYPEFGEALKGKEMVATVFAPYEGKNRLVGFTPVSSIGWAASAGKREEDVTGPIFVSLANNALLFVFALLIAFFVALAVSRKITRPIAALRVHALALGSGEVPQQAGLHEISEFRDLAEAFNTMAERVRTRETDLRESEERYRALVESAPDAVIVHRNGQFIYANAAALSLYGADTLEQLQSRNVLDLIHPDDRAAIAERMQQGQAGQSLGMRETKMVRLDGQVVPVESVGGMINYRGSPAVQIIIRDITERRRADEELCKSREDLDRAQEVGQTGSWRMDVRRNVLTWSDENHRIFGVPKGTPMTYETFLGSVHPDDREYVDTQWKVGLRGEPYDIEHRIVVTGQIKWVREKAYLEFDDAGALLGGFGITQDITERKRAEQAVRDGEERLRFALETSQTGAWQLNLVDHTAFRSLEHDRIFGYTELLPQWTYPMFLDHILPEDRAEVDAKFLHATETRSDWSFECRIRRADGEVRWIWAAGRHRADETGFPRYMTGIVQDITDRKRAENALKEAKAQLEERVKERTYELYAESLYARSLIEASLDPLVTISIDGKITDVNRATEEVTGLPRAQLVGSDFSDYFTEPEKARDGYAEVFRHGFVRDYPLELKHRDGQVTPVHYNATLYRDETGRAMGVFAAARDISERKRAEAALRKLASELVMAEERERKRIAGVLHDDIAQVLAAARIRLDILQGMSLNEEHKRIIKETSAYLLQTLQDTRALMTDIGNPLLFDMGLKAACESLASRMMERYPVRIDCNIRDAFKSLHPDVKTILYQAVRELLNNVAKHSYSKHAHVSADVENGQCQVKVTDDGRGFDPQTLGEPTLEGGFGLFSIRERLMAMGGSLRIDSKPGAGTVVTAMLPLDPSREVQSEGRKTS